jgi:PAS domain S-box-containing protein
MEITERKRAEEALRESEERYHMVLEASPDPVVAYDMEGKCTYINPAFTPVFGWLPEELLGKKLEYVPHENWPETQMMIEKVQAGESFSRVESRRYTKHGNILDVSISAAIHRNPDGIPMGSVHILRDITDHKLAEEALRKAHDELEQRVKERTAELAKTNKELLEYDHIVAHVLKAPLRAIHYYSDFLSEELEGTLKENQKTYLDSLTRAVRRAAGLVDDLLEFSMVGRRSGPIETIDIGVFLQELIVSLDLPSDVEVVMGNEWPSIEAEPALVQKIFLHLIRNAVKFNRSPRKCIEIGWLPAGDEHYELFVRDNGIGIEPRYHEQIFDVFQRLFPEEYEGAGIGLAICKKIVQRHGGRIWVESELGKGSTFYFTISSAG